MKISSYSKENIIVEMINITKKFGGVCAVDNVNLELHKGEVLAIVGDNAAGKSTLVKILSGAYIKDSGQIIFNKKKVEFRNPNDARKLGIETLYQTLALFDKLDISSNIFINREILYKGARLIGLLNVKEMKEKTKKLLKDFSIYESVGNINRNVANLSGGQRQLVALCRAVKFKAKIIIMDEPTAALGVKETKLVYNFINELRKQKISIIIISHNINEVFDIADRFMILKTGKLVGTVLKKNSSIDEIVTMIVSGKQPVRA